jgi:hypothetical protein
MDIPNGTYSIMLTDANGCTLTYALVINYTVVSATAIDSDPLCSGDTNGEVSINAQN